MQADALNPRKWPQTGSRCSSSGKVHTACGVGESIYQRLQMLEHSCAILVDSCNVDRKQSEDLRKTVAKLQERRAADQQRIALLSQEVSNVHQPPHAPSSIVCTTMPQTRIAVPKIFGISTPREKSPSDRHSVEEFIISTPRKTQAVADSQTIRRQSAETPGGRCGKSARFPRRALWSCASQSLCHLAVSVSAVDPLRVGQRILAKALLSQEQQRLARRHTERVAAFGFVITAWQVGRSGMRLWARAVMSVAASRASCFGRLPIGAKRIRAIRRALTCIAAVASLTGMPSWVHAAAQLLSFRSLPKALRCCV